MSEAIFEGPAWIYKLFYIIIIAAVAIFLVSAAIKSDLNTKQIQSDLLLNKILYSPTSFWMTQGGLTRIGTVDKSLFADNYFQTAFVYPKNYGGAHLTLTTLAKSGVVADTTESWINKDTYLNYANNYRAGVKNGGTVERHMFPVYVNDGTQVTRGYLVIDIAMPKEA